MSSLMAIPETNALMRSDTATLIKRMAANGPRDALEHVGADGTTPAMLVTASLLTLPNLPVSASSSSKRKAEKLLATIVQYVRDYAPGSVTIATLSTERLLLSNGSHFTSAVASASMLCRL